MGGQTTAAPVYERYDAADVVKSNPHGHQWG
jgi:hypothetical protein